MHIYFSLVSNSFHKTTHMSGSLLALGVEGTSSVYCLPAAVLILLSHVMDRKLRSILQVNALVALPQQVAAC